MNSYQPGDIVVVDLGETIGHEQEGRRPVVVVSQILIGNLIVIIPLTRKEKSWWTVVRIKEGEGGVKMDSFALCHQIRSISLKRVIEKWSRIESDTLARIKTVLANIFEWSPQ